MAAIVFAPAPWRFFAFPLVVHWQAHYTALSFYFPDLSFGLLTDAPAPKGFPALLQPPRQASLATLGKHFQPGELSQWQAYLDFLAAQEYRDESDLKEAIRGHLAPVLPEEIDLEVLWSLAHQLEQMLADKAAGLQRLAGQQQVLERILSEDFEEEEALDPSLQPPLVYGLPDVESAQVRLRFWRAVLAPHLTPPWAALVLEAAAGESSPRYLWQAAAAEGTRLWQAGFVLPDWRPAPAGTTPDIQGLELSVEFRKVLGELLTALAENPAQVEACREKVLRLAADRLWPASGLGQAQAVYLELYGWLDGPPEQKFLSGPMLFWSPAG